MGKKKTSPLVSGNAVLVPVDFSPDSKAALLFAAGLADGLGAKLLVLHVVHDPGDAPGYYRIKGHKTTLRRLEDVAEEMLVDFMKGIRAANPGLASLKKADQKLVVGLPVPRILEFVKAKKPVMVVMGSAGRTGLARALLGSKAEQTMRLCPVPVTIVKGPGHEKKPDKNPAVGEEGASDD